MTKNEFVKRYGEEAYKELLKKQKQYKDAHKREIKQYDKQYNDAHSNERKQYKDAHSEELKQYQKQYNKTLMGRAVRLANAYNQADKVRGFDISNNIDYSYIVKRIFSGKCIYCGDDNWEHLGCDRIDNTKPHTPDNVVCACGICNIERGDRMSVNEMVEHRTTNPRVLRDLNVPIEKTPTGAIKKRVFAVIG